MKQILLIEFYLGDGITKTFKLLDVDKENNWIEVPNELIVSNDVINFTNIICTVYKNFCKKYDDSLYLKERMIVNPTNEILDEINKKCCIWFQQNKELVTVFISFARIHSILMSLKFYILLSF